MINETKDQLRRDFFSQRKQLGTQERRRQSDVLCGLLLDWYRGLEAAQRRAKKVALTIKFGTEPDTDPIMEALYGDGVEVWVPISHRDRSMSWTQWWPDVEMQKSALAPILEPTGQRFGPEAVVDADVVFVPALAADTAGYRLGKGGGYYDRFLAMLPTLSANVPTLITPVFDHEFFAAETEAFPVGEHDLPVQAVATAQSGIVWC
ncbi:MAG TPA: 5-formyltetrahydrofolate cyclo-ligase [Candidatus Yaniella excrementigallinarum]|nr:5-formyltetrahydrofolate cyclo-ligase [Candidatus Yaniella excrementigallinarum]